VALLFSLSVHESAHAASAYWLEDDTARRLGRMTLNPLAHIDILGTLVLPLLGMLTGWRVLGWAKPVPVDPSNLSRKYTVRTGMAMVAGAGPASNLLLSLVCIPALALALGVLLPHVSPDAKFNIFRYAMYAPVEELSKTQIFGADSVFLITFLGRMISINIGLAIFNLLPFGPLDGASILRGFLPRGVVPAFDRVQPALTIIVLVLFFVGGIQYILMPFFFVIETLYLNPLSRLFLGA
jgi:Zn-dependent protease